MSSFIQTIKTIILAAILSLGISFVYAWTAPTVAPTGGNTSAPINTSAVNQTKSGTLTLNRTDGVQGLETYGTTTLATVTGKVGIGTATPGERLSVYGANNAGASIALYTNLAGATYQKIFHVGNTGSAVNDGYFQLSDSGTVKVNVAANNSRGGDTYFNGGGNVGIGTTDPKTKLDVNGPVRVGQYSTKPTCDANTKGSIVFDTTNDKPYVCAASGVWKPLDSDGDKDGLIASFDNNDNIPKSATSATAPQVLSGYTTYGYSGGTNGTWSEITGTYTPTPPILPTYPLTGACTLELANWCRTTAFPQYGGKQSHLVGYTYNNYTSFGCMCVLDGDNTLSPENN